jgi:uncharacterized protein (DUF885 family)
MRTILFGIILFALSGITFAQTGSYADSAKIEQLFNNFYRDYIKLNPEDAVGIPSEWGYQFDRAGWNDLSPAGIKANYDLFRKYLTELENLNQSAITPPQLIDSKILIWFLKTYIEGEKYLYHKYYLDYLFGVHAQITTVLTGYHTISNSDDAENYITRLDRMPTRINQAIDLVKTQEKMGLRPPVFIINRFIESIGDFRNSAPQDNLFVADLRSKLTQLNPNDSIATARLCGKAEIIVKDKIYPAYDSLIAVSRAMAKNADSTAGLWRMPDGNNYYNYCLKFHTTSTSSAEDIFNRGLQQVNLIQSKALLILDSFGIRGDKNYGALMNDYYAYCKTPEVSAKYNYPDGPQKRQMILDDYTAILNKAESHLPEAFSFIPKAKVVVQPVPEYREQGGLTYYEAPSLDGKRTGTFYINMLSPLPKPGMWPLIFHETVPGHHLQLATQQEMSTRRIYKTLIFLPGFGEGWAMYAEEIADELGWYPDQASRLAELNSQLFRAVRVVLDAGIHYKKWTKDQALQYMIDNLGWNSVNEIDRYIDWPGQACSYTLGKLKFIDLREKAKKELGDKFKLADFHTEVLKYGSMPLDILEEVVNNYIERNK